MASNAELLNKWLVRYNELIRMDRTHEAKQVLRCVNDVNNAALAPAAAPEAGEGVRKLLADLLERDGGKACNCIHHSRKAEREYEAGKCPHQRATAFLAAAPAPQEGGREDAVKLDVLRIPRSDKLDPMVVYFEDYAPGQGRITVACYGDAWTASWGQMGDRTVREFVAGVDAGYLSGAFLQLCGGNDRHRNYTDRIAAAVIAALAAHQQRGKENG